MNLPFNPANYDRTIIAFSGGKDSLACVLWALKTGCPNIELWHHLVDGSTGQSTLMDWPCTTAYCRLVAKALGLPIYFSWLDGGFEREMLRENARKASTYFETPNGQLKKVGGDRGKLNTRLKFPQVSADLSVRWCSAYLKVDTCSSAIRNQDRFNHSKTLLITGERAEESAARAKYAIFEPDRADGRNGRKQRHIDRLRPILHWKEADAWALIQEWNILAHPAYRLGWGRLSCMSCIFGSADQWATIRAIAPDHFEKIARYEERFKITIKRSISIRQTADKGIPYPAALNNPELVKLALSADYSEPITTEPGTWKLPAGAFGENAGPT